MAQDNQAPKDWAEFFDRLPTNMQFMIVREPSYTIVRCSLEVGRRVCLAKRTISNEAIADSAVDIRLLTACEAVQATLDAADAAMYAEGRAAAREREEREREARG